MSDDLQRRGLLADIPRHLAALGPDALRIVDEFVLGAMLHERAHGPIVLEALSRQTLELDPHRDPTGTAIAAAIQAIGIGLLEQDQQRAELHEQARDEMVPRRTLTADARKRLDERRDRGVAEAIAARPDLYRAPVSIGLPGDDLSDPVVVDGFAADQHLTRLDSTPQVIALCEQPRGRDEDLEVDLELETGDAEEPIGVQIPDYDFEGGAG